MVEPRGIAAMHDINKTAPNFRGRFFFIGLFNQVDWISNLMVVIAPIPLPSLTISKLPA